MRYSVVGGVLLYAGGEEQVYYVVAYLLVVLEQVLLLGGRSGKRRVCCRSGGFDMTIVYAITSRLLMITEHKLFDQLRITQKGIYQEPLYWNEG